MCFVWIKKKNTVLLRDCLPTNVEELSLPYYSSDKIWIYGPKCIGAKVNVKKLNRNSNTALSFLVWCHSYTIGAIKKKYEYIKAFDSLEDLVVWKKNMVFPADIVTSNYAFIFIVWFYFRVFRRVDKRRKCHIVSHTSVFSIFTKLILVWHNLL